MSTGLFTVFDCRTGGVPFAARTLHEVVHHWTHAARELATFGPGDRIELGLCFMRRGGLEHTIPWGLHSRSSVHACLDILQAAWVSDSDLGPEGPASMEESVAQVLKEAEVVLLGGEGPASNRNLAIQIWSFQPAHAVLCLRDAPSLKRMFLAGVEVTVVSLQNAHAPMGIGEAWEDGNQNLQVAAALAELPLKVVKVAPTKSAMVRHLRRCLLVQIAVNLHLPDQRTAEPTTWDVDSAQPHVDTEFFTKSIRCSCAPVVFLLPGQHETATAQQSIIDFKFERFVKVTGIEPYHLYGIPLVTRAAEVSLGLASRLAERRSGCWTAAEALAKLAQQLAKGELAAVYSSKMCPMELTLGSRTFFYLATAPQGCDATSELSVLILRGLVSHHVATASLPAPSLKAGGECTKDEGIVLVDLQLDSWPHMSLYNPLAHSSTPPLSLLHAEAQGLPPPPMPSGRGTGGRSGRSGRSGRGGGRGKQSSRSAMPVETAEAQQISWSSVALETVDVHVPPPCAAPPATTKAGWQLGASMPGAMPCTSVSAQPAMPLADSDSSWHMSAAGRADAATSAASLSRLFPLLQQPPKRRTYGATTERAVPFVSPTETKACPHLSTQEAESIAAGHFDFKF
eukprot:TRINITY_DN45959_c0_g1_i1.p1 TRINITY_DN45959_c0_g1~~TRINITY_DN45959_c0_g1_i1.p1  ORF type:complete len:626 (-),score=104.23 TRINITY_DN45959_c0_g1_i1:209-2086(-)